MSEFVTIPIIQTMGSAAKGVGRAGVMLEAGEKANASIIVPRTGLVSLHMVASANEPHPNVQIYAGYTKGRGTFKEEWIPPSGQVGVSIEGVDTSNRMKLLDGISVEEGEFLGVRIENLTQGFRLGLCCVFLKYHG